MLKLFVGFFVSL